MFEMTDVHPPVETLPATSLFSRVATFVDRDVAAERRRCRQRLYNETYNDDESQSPENQIVSVIANAVKQSRGAAKNLIFSWIGSMMCHYNEVGFILAFISY
jgi:hypothetical protein